MASCPPRSGLVQTHKEPCNKPPPQSAYLSVIIKVRVGSLGKEFNIHKDLLCHHSSYFRAALTGGLKEAKARQITLIDDCPETFKIFASWAYSGQLYDPKDPSTVDPESMEPAGRTVVSLSQTDLAKLWIFGDKRGIPGLQNQAINDLHLHLLETWAIEASAATLAFVATFNGSKLRAYLIEAHALILGPSMMRYGKVYPSRLLLKLRDRLIQLRDESPIVNKKDFMASLDMCQCHVHDNVDCKGRKVKKPAATVNVKEED